MGLNSDELVHRARAAFGPEWRPHHIATAPGRLELLGNHVDYNGGLVLAGAIDRVIRAVSGGQHPNEQSVRVFAPDVSPEIITVPLDPDLARGIAASTSTAAYLAGIVLALQESGTGVRAGQEIAVSGDVPVGFGMSSSAALCVSLTLLLSEADLPSERIVAIARRAEHITGAPVGAMDQSASVAGGVILFDGTDASVEQVDPDLGDLVFAVANSGVHHALSDSAYPVRVRESQEALALIRAHTDLAIDHLGEITSQQWRRIEETASRWLSSTLTRRVRHVVSEVERVRQGVVAIRERDWTRFGELMTASGRSSATDYEISHPVVEELVAELNRQAGVLGARMMGGGEGGPALALLHREAVADVREALSASFFAKHGMHAEQAFEVCAFGPGARVEHLQDHQESSSSRPVKDA
jgi:galactokinase